MAILVQRQPIPQWIPPSVLRAPSQYGGPLPFPQFARIVPRGLTPVALGGQGFSAASQVAAPLAAVNNLRVVGKWPLPMVGTPWLVRYGPAQQPVIVLPIISVPYASSPAVSPASLLRAAVVLAPTLSSGGGRRYNQQPFNWYALAKQPAWLVGSDKTISLIALAMALGLDDSEMAALVASIEGE